MDCGCWRRPRPGPRGRSCRYSSLCSVLHSTTALQGGARALATIPYNYRAAHPEQFSSERMQRTQTSSEPGLEVRRIAYK